MANIQSASAKLSIDPNHDMAKEHTHTQVRTYARIKAFCLESIPFKSDSVSC